MPLPGRILVVDDHPVFRMGMVSLLRMKWPAATVVESDGANPLSLGEGSHPFDLAVLDHHLGPADGLALIEQLRAMGTRVVMVSMDDDACASEIARERGASVWIRKDSDPAKLMVAIERAMHGEDLWAGSAKRLSPMERAVLDALNNKEPLPEVAAKLGVTYSTLNTHKRRLFRKLGKLPGLD